MREIGDLEHLHTWVRKSTTQLTDYGRDQCVNCLNKESETEGGSPVCRVTGMIMKFVYPDCHYRKVR